MDTSHLLATFLGVCYLSIGVGMYTSRLHYEKLYRELQTSSWVIYLAGVLALVFGFLVVSFHNIWESNWTVVITIFGWIALLKGILLLALPDLSLKFIGDASWVLKFAWMIILFGILFCYFGLFAGSPT